MSGEGEELSRRIKNLGTKQFVLRGGKKGGGRGKNQKKGRNF